LLFACLKLESQNEFNFIKIKNALILKLIRIFRNFKYSIIRLIFTKLEKIKLLSRCDVSLLSYTQSAFVILMLQRSIVLNSLCDFKGCLGFYEYCRIFYLIEYTFVCTLCAAMKLNSLIFLMRVFSQCD